jgi:hypothetical protein
LGGKGSGRWFYPDAKMTTESLHRIEVGVLKRHGCFQPGSEGILYHFKSGSTRISVSFRSAENKITLYCRFNHATGRQVIHQMTSIELDHQPCHFGGSRTWFLCPNCGRRTLALYSVAGLFHCRICHRLTYVSQQSNKIDRLIHKIHKIYEKLGAGNTDVFVLIPKKRRRCMRRSTYQKLHEAAEEAQLQLAEAIIQRFGALN